MIRETYQLHDLPVQNRFVLNCKHQQSSQVGIGCIVPKAALNQVCNHCECKSAAVAGKICSHFKTQERIADMQVKQLPES